MSKDDSRDQESDAEIHNCPVGQCDYTSKSHSGVMNHFGYHEEEVKRGRLLDEIHSVADRVGRTPRREDMNDYGDFTHYTYHTHFDGWNDALREAGFDLNHRWDISKDKLLDELRRLADELGHTPSQHHMAEYGKYSKKGYLRVFGSWPEAVKAAGFEPLGPLSGENHPRWTPDEKLIEEIQRIADILGRTPRRDDLNDHSDYCRSTFFKRFGGWNNALKAAGFGPTHHLDIADGELLDELHRLSDKLERVPHASDMAESGRFSVAVYRSHFGSWNDALETAGMEPTKRRNIPKGEILDEIQRLADKLDRTPRYGDMTEHGKFGVSVCEYRFGTWTEALKAAGLDIPSPQDFVPSGEDSPHWSGGVFPYGPGWNEAKKEQVRERDDRTCQNPKCRRSEAEHIERFGRKHAVHHIQKARSFDDPEKRNHPDNLITLCISKECHLKWEKMSPLRPIVD